MKKNNNWTKENIPSLKGKVIIVTGGNSGLGFESVKAFVEKGAEVIMTCRNQEKGEKARKHILQHNREALIHVMFLDLTDLKSVHEFATRFSEKFNRLDVLLNNAGILKVPYRLTVDGFESQQATNFFGHFALTGLLLNVLKATPGSRVVNVSSLAHRFGDMNFENLMYQNAEEYSSMGAYNRSKLENLLFTFELQRFFEINKYDISALVAHPGVSGTNIFNHIGGDFLIRYLKPVFNRFVQSPQKGALPQIRASVDPSAKGGEFYGPNGTGELRGYPVLVKASALANDRETALKLWKYTEKITGVNFK